MCSDDVSCACVWIKGAVERSFNRQVTFDQNTASNKKDNDTSRCFCSSPNSIFHAVFTDYCRSSPALSSHAQLVRPDKTSGKP